MSRMYVFGRQAGWEGSGFPGFWGWRPWQGFGFGCNPRGGFGRGGFSGWGPGAGAGFGQGFGQGMGRGPGRMFDAGEMKLVILKLISEQPSYGYQIIKALEERFSGEYTPSPGVVYPTLTMLEEEGLTESSRGGAETRKVYSITPEGTAYLKANKEKLEAIFEHALNEAGKRFGRGRSPELMRAVMNLRGALVTRMWRSKPNEAQMKKIIDAINAAAKSIDEA